MRQRFDITRLFACAVTCALVALPSTAQVAIDVRPGAPGEMVLSWERTEVRVPITNP